MDYTVNKFICLLDLIRENGIRVYSIEKAIRENPTTGIILRHDVDRLPKNALRIARLEAERNIYSTFYFRIIPHAFNKKIINEISELGHEVGYHYEDLSLAKGDFNRARKTFKKHLAVLRELAPVNTIAMHGRPLSGSDNRDLWKLRNFEEYGLIGEAFLSIDYSDKHYFTDTGRNWDPNKSNLRDKTDTLKSSNVKTTNDLIEFVSKNPNATVALVTHPERWNNNLFKWVLYFFFDIVVNLIKIFLKLVISRK